MLAPKHSDKVDHAKLGKRVEEALLADYIYILGSTKRQVWGSLMRGFFAGLGGVIGATLGVALLLAILAYLGTAPIIGEYIRDIADAISQGRQ